MIRHNLPSCLRAAMAALLFCAALWPGARSSAGESPDPTAVPDLISFWTFSEPAGQPRVAKGPNAYKLAEVKGPIDSVAEGPFGSAARIKSGQWFKIPRAECPALDIHGKGAQVTVVAWIKRESGKGWHAIAGVWDETRGKRQYCLFVNGGSKTNHKTMKRTPSKDLVHGHVSAVGGPTPGEKYCITYSSSRAPIPQEEWHCVAMSYDGKHSRVYIDGVLDADAETNPFPYDEGLFDGGTEGADFTVGSVSAHDKPNNFFVGLIGGLAVYKRALTDDEMKQLGAMKK